MTSEAFVQELLEPLRESRRLGCGCGLRENQSRMGIA
jgi:hypothetical protein